ncbi:MAG: hypothetical protein ACJA1O_000531 [Spirosomataceae bacterium]|jgi:hypothetical protein
MLRTLLLIFLLSIPFLSSSQNVDIEAIKKNDPLKIGGALNANVVYNSQKITGMPPISYFLSGTVNFNFWGFDIPLSLNYSNRKFTYSQPFSYNFATLRPTYKWVSAEIGTCFTTFSPYSLSGHQFQGIGVNLTPNKWDISLMNGRLLKATIGDQNIPPSFNRMGRGIKTIYRGNNYSLGFSLFNAFDQKESLALSDSLLPQAKENMVVGLEFSTTLFKRFQLSGDYHSSALNSDKSQINNERNTNKSISALFLNRNANIETFNSYKIALNTNLSKLNSIIGVSYQKVDPNYTTLGGYYFVNDFQNISANYAQNLFSGKLNLTSSVGFQKDNLSRQKSSSQNRVVGTVGVQANPSEKLNFNLNFSNFTSYSFISTVYDEIKQLNPFEQLDTLNYKQINQNFTSSINYALSKTEENQKSLNLNFSVMESINKQGDIVRIGQESGFVNASLLYSSQYIKKRQGMSVGLNTSYNSIGIGNSYSLGPLLNMQKSFLKDRLSSSSSISYIYSKDPTANIQTGAINLRGNANYAINKQSGFTGNFGLTNVGGNTVKKQSYISLTVGFTSRF